MAFTNEQLERYSRHIILKEVGVKGQKKLLNAKVLIIGAGGLGAPAAMYLAAAGVKKARHALPAALLAWLAGALAAAYFCKIF